MNKLTYYILSAILSVLFFSSCSDDEKAVPAAATLNAIKVTSHSLEFSLTPQHADQCAWMCYKKGETAPTAEDILNEAIGNLVDNSIKYSGEEVDIQISSLRQDYNFYLIKVRDNGIGIPLKDQSRIFEKYERASAADRSRKGGASGFGLGLNYVFRVAEAHGGKVCVESIEGEYSEFFLFLPSGEKK